VHIHRPAYPVQLYAYTYFKPVCAYKKHAYADLVKNPNPEHKTVKQSRNLKRRK